MFKKPQYLLLPLVIASAFAILFVSFQSANSNALAEDLTLKDRKFYFEKEILPDHSVYPLLMAVDRLRLGVAEPEKKAYLQASYANRRFFYASRLVEKGEFSLATTTFTKAQKYLNQSMIEAIELLDESDDYNIEIRQELAFFVLDNLTKGSQILAENKDQLTMDGKVTIDSLEEETIILREKLEEKLFDL